MPQLKSAEKRLRQSLVRRQRNRARRSEIKTEIRRLERISESGDAAAARDSLRRVFSLLDAAVSGGTIKKNHASRYKSRLSKKVHRLKPEAPAE